MAALTLDPQQHTRLADWLRDGSWVVACLCAAWCDTCRSYRAGFDRLATQHPDKHFVWIDIEDESDLVGDIDVDNFPTLLIQRGDTVAFFGTVLPEPTLADRLILAQTGKSDAELQAHTDGAQGRAWQQECNLRSRLAAAQE